MTDTLLEIENLHISFTTSRGVLDAVVGVSFDIQRGEIFGIVGETGCGKTVTGLSVLGLLPSRPRSKRDRFASKAGICYTCTKTR